MSLPSNGDISEELQCRALQFGVKAEAGRCALWQGVAAVAKASWQYHELGFSLPWVEQEVGCSDIIGGQGLNLERQFSVPCLS